MGDSNRSIAEVLLVPPGIQADGQLCSVFRAEGVAPGHGYLIQVNGDWVSVAKPSKPGAPGFYADIPRENVRAVVYKPDAPDDSGESAPTAKGKRK